MTTTNNKNLLVSFLKAPSIIERVAEITGKDKANVFISSLITLINSNSNFQSVNQHQFITLALKAAQFDLPIDSNLGFCYLIPYKEQLTFQIGYKGLIQLAQRSGMLKKLNVIAIYASQLKSYNPLSDDIEIDFNVNFKPKTGEEYAYYIGYMELTNGFKKISLWSKDNIIKYAKAKSKTYNNPAGAWQLHFDSMAKKTVLKSLLSVYSPLSTTYLKIEAIENESETSTIKELGVNNEHNINNSNANVLDVKNVDAKESTETDVVNSFKTGVKSKEVKNIQADMTTLIENLEV